MDRPTLIDFDGVSKKYCRDFRRALWYGVRDLAKELTCLSKEEDKLRPSEFWALKDVSFRVKSGESLGLIGRNGAGKTTILKLIGGLIKPSQGRISIDGSVRALIALGAGFNPLLTGRENIGIAGAVLGFSRKEMARQYAQIAEFSELGEFLDSPVQSYSSGMLARLGFSVAIHTLPDILLVDEVLAVGDLGFAIKCYRKISDYRSQGGAIILVSHSLYAVRSNCDRALWVDKGAVRQVGDQNDVCSAYEHFLTQHDSASFRESFTDDAIEILDVNYPRAIRSGEKFYFEFAVKSKKTIEKPVISFGIQNTLGQCVLANHSPLDSFTFAIKEGRTLVGIEYAHLPLAVGVYYANLAVADTYVNNQLAAYAGFHKFEVGSDVPTVGSGVLSLRPIWKAVPQSSGEGQ